ncbi:hypothetical protein [Dactylosporangium sp. CA-233914]|uniref:hypothetical protein n=1 Tax=Dactylosporangium sp. CA-233914 TaxID=3239934 RepID=UPI003D8DBDDC
MGDPFAGLDTSWAKAAERRAVRANRFRRLGGLLRRRRRGGGSRGRRRLLLIGGIAAAAVVASFGLSFLLKRGPFDGTPAEDYARGVAGIGLPAAAAVEGFTAGQVDDALRQVRAALVAARLDPRMLTGHDPAALVALLAPQQRESVSGWFGDPRQHGFATFVDPAARLDADEEPRVRGTVTYNADTADGRPTLHVLTNFVWVYAFAGDGLAAPYAAVHDQLRWDFPAGQGMWLGTGRWYVTHMDCDALRHGLLSPMRQAKIKAGIQFKDPRDYLDAGHTMDVTNTCDG